ncbi:hypothetical protein MMC14_002382 [Varicellaria rhodocarpa]|nr:hypothetical protein [Varicellaria rhodocarpa]
MQVAEILSDLTSLRVCDHGAALAFVSSHKALSSTSEASPKDYVTANLVDKDSSAPSDTSSTLSLTGIRSSPLEDTEDDLDLQRAIDLVDLHYGVKKKHMQGVDMNLSQARTDVNRVLEKLRVKDESNPRRR